MQYSGNNSEGINNVDILNDFQNSVEPLFSLNFEGKLEKNPGEAKIISNLLSKSISIQIKCETIRIIKPILMERVVTLTWSRPRWLSILEQTNKYVLKRRKVNCIVNSNQTINIYLTVFSNSILTLHGKRAIYNGFGQCWLMWSHSLSYITHNKAIHLKLSKIEYKNSLNMCDIDRKSITKT